MKPTSLLAAFFPFLAATLHCQTPDHLVGITRNAPFLRHHDHQNCALIGQCGLAGMPPSTPLPAFVGGTAWDPTRSGAWVSNGLLIAKYDDTCAMQCAPMAIPTLPAGGFVTGLEVVEGQNQLWMIDNFGNLHRYTNACPPMPLGVCNAGLMPMAVTQVTTGLAVDEGLGLVFVAFPDFAAGINWISVALLTNPCVQLSRFPAPPCFAAFGTILGLACDWGKRILYATDGQSTIAMTYAWAPPNMVVMGFNCCAGPAGADPMIGLAVRPGRATSVGGPCASAPCPACPMTHTLGNDPNLGNAAFRLDLNGAPAGSFAWCLIGQGPCMVPGIAPPPPFCGPIHTIPYLGALGANATGGIAVCDGATTFNLPLPLTSALAGSVYSSQCIALCVGGGTFGFTQSNCLSWELQGN